MKDNNYYREIMINHYLIIILCLFLVVYIVINYNTIQEGNIYGGNISKTIIISGIIFLILYIFMTWEDDDIDDELDENMVIIPKYRIINKINIRDNEPKEINKENNYNNKYNKDISNKTQQNSINKLEISDDKVENSNIFIPQKNKAKFGIKF